MPSDPIQHVVVLMLENHSFDQMLGGLKAENPEIEGIDSGALQSNLDKDGRPYIQAQTNAASISPDPMHEVLNVRTQLENGNSGFVLDYSSQYPDTTTAQRQEIMGFYSPGSLSALHELARHFTVCDHWFASVPGPTWTNRFFVHSGTALGRVIMPSGGNALSHFFGYDQDTVYDRLNERDVSWRVYFGDIPQSLVLSHQRLPKNALRYRPMAEFYADAADSNQPFPAYSFIEPAYYWPQNDDHPPHPTALAEQLIANVYNAIRQNDSLWNSTLLVVLYDEHGGFYDHISPPTAVPPDAHIEEYTFDRLGVRVPALLVSPWVDQGVVHTVFDHTSLLRYLSDKWNLGPLGNRAMQANSFVDAISAITQPRDDTPDAITLPPAQQALAVAANAQMPDMEQPPNEHQNAMIEFSEILEKEIQEPAVLKEARSLAAKSISFLTRTEAAKGRVLALLAQHRARTD
jgi:phospholipase C